MNSNKNTQNMDDKKINIPSDLDLNDLLNEASEEFDTNNKTIRYPSFESDMINDIKSEEAITIIFQNIAPVIWLYLEKEAEEKAENSDKNDKPLKIKAKKDDSDIYAVIIIHEFLRKAKEQDLDYVCCNGKYYKYNGKYYEEIQSDFLGAILEIAAINSGLEPKFASRKQFIKTLLSQFEQSALKKQEEFSANEVRVNLQNGVLCTKNGVVTFREHQKEDFHRYILPFGYDTNAQCVKFTKYLNEVLPDIESQMILGEAMGYVFAKHLNLSKCLVCIGNGRNGKSLFFKIMIALFGADNVSNFSFEDLCDKSGNTRVQLENKLLNYTDEMSRKFDQSIFKTLVSNEPITGRFLYNDTAKITNYARLATSTNLFPENIEATHGSMERYLFVHFRRTFTKEEQNPHLGDEIISEELSGVFNWVLEGLERLIAQNKFTESQTSNNVLEQFKASVDTVADFLNQEQYTPSLSETIQLTTLFKEYKEFCEKNGFQNNTDSRGLMKSLEQIGYVGQNMKKGGYKHVFIEKKIHKEIMDFFENNNNE